MITTSTNEFGAAIRARARPIQWRSGAIFWREVKMYRYWTRLSHGAVASAAVIVVGFASMTGPAYADHNVDHTVENLKGGLGALEERVWDCEHGIGGACPGTTGPGRTARTAKTAR